LGSSSATRASDALARRLELHLGARELREHADPGGAVTRLRRYFAGECGALAEQPVEIHGTFFQAKVWNALRTISAGTTWTYTQLAGHIGRPEARRAVGAANGANPIALFVPCHRVIAAGGTLWGYGGGLERKRWLLVHEGAAFVGFAAQDRRALESAERSVSVPSARAGEFEPRGSRRLVRPRTPEGHSVRGRVHTSE
jgi:methylated-DNA-[protein]-cysteine S-methyltransferase